MLLGDRTAPHSLEALSFRKMAATRMYCEDSLEELFVGLLQEVEAYEFTGRGILVMTFRGRGGSMNFR